MPKRRGRGRRRRNPRTQRSVRIITQRTGVGRATEVETSEWLRPPTSWDLAAHGMRMQVQKAEHIQKKQARRRYINRVENQKEARAERWRARFRKSTDSPFSSLPGMSERTGATHRKPPVVSEDTRRSRGLAAKGPPSTLDPQTAQVLLSRTAEGQTVSAIAKELGIPRTTLSKWLSSGRAEKVAAAVGEG